MHDGLRAHRDGVRRQERLHGRRLLQRRNVHLYELRDGRHRLRFSVPSRRNVHWCIELLFLHNDRTERNGVRRRKPLHGVGHLQRRDLLVRFLCDARNAVHHDGLPERRGMWLVGPLRLQVGKSSLRRVGRRSPVAPPAATLRPVTTRWRRSDASGHSGPSQMTLSRAALGLQSFRCMCVAHSRLRHC
jgi:hypothetical protein